MKKISLAALALLLASALSVPAAAATAPLHDVAVGQMKFQMELPKDIAKTDFFTKTYAKVFENGAVSDYEMLGTPFLHDGKTYVPVRDVAEAFGIEVEYKAADRFVALRSNDRALFIPPEAMNVGSAFQRPGISSAYEAAAYKNGAAFNIASSSGTNKPTCSYLLFNDRSYVPLRAILEFFDFGVSYDSLLKTIAVDGTKAHGGMAASSFSKEQEAIIGAVSSYDAAKSLLYEELAGSALEFYGSALSSASRVKETAVNVAALDASKSSAAKITNAAEVSNKYYLTTDDGVAYEATYSRTLYGENGAVYPIVSGHSGIIDKVLASGEKEWVDMWATGLSHPFLWVGDTVFSGSNKYKEMAASKLSETALTETFLITMLDGVELEVEVEIEKSSGKLCRYSEKNPGGTGFQPYRSWLARY